MKTQYMKPELGAKHYAQFENVFTGCSKTGNGKKDNCIIDANVTSSGYNTITGLQESSPNGWCAHNGTSSSN